MKLFFRFFWYLLKLGALVALVVWLAQQSGEVHFTFFGYIVQMPSGLLVAFVVLLIVLAMIADQFFSWTWRLPRRWRTYREKKNWLRGKDAVLGGLIALNMGDQKATHKYLSRLQTSFSNDPILHLLEAQAAWRSGDLKRAQESFTLLGRHRATASLSKVGLLRLAVEQEHKDEAWQIGKSLLGTPAIPKDALTAIFNLAAERAEWAIADHALDSMQLDKNALAEKKAALLSERARLALEISDGAAAKQLSKDALKWNSGFLPAKIFMLRALLALGKNRRAAKQLKQYWDERPDFALLPFYWETAKGKDDITRAQEIKSFTGKHPGHPASLALAAQINLSAGLWGEARRHLTSLADLETAEMGLSSLTCTMFAELENKQGHMEEAKLWLKKLEGARHPPSWYCRSCLEVSPGWSLHCPACHAQESIGWNSPSPAITGVKALPPLLMEKPAAS